MDHETSLRIRGLLKNEKYDEAFRIMNSQDSFEGFAEIKEKILQNLQHYKELSEKILIAKNKNEDLTQAFTNTVLEVIDKLKESNKEILYQEIKDQGIKDVDIPNFLNNLKYANDISTIKKGKAIISSVPRRYIDINRRKLQTLNSQERKIDGFKHVQNVFFHRKRKLSEELEDYFAVRLNNIIEIEIKSLIGLAKLDEALNRLINYLVELKSSDFIKSNANLNQLSDFLILLKSRLERNKTLTREGVITSEESDRTLNKIAKSLLEFISEFNNKSNINNQTILNLAVESPWDSITAKYIEDFKYKHSHIRIFGMNEKRPIDDLYVRVNILKKITSRISLSLQKLEEQFNRNERRLNLKIETIDAENLVNNYEKFIVLGKPGAGKTTFLKFLGLLYLNKNTKIKNIRLPVFVNLKNYGDSELTLFDYISRKFNSYNIPDHVNFTKGQLIKGQLIILLDGLDEVNKPLLENTVQQIIDISDKYRGNQYVISCRIASYNHWFSQFTDVEIADFNKEQIKSFIRKWFHNESHVARECFHQLIEKKQLIELATNPLLLTLICITFDETYNFPANRADLYEKSINALLEKWDSTRRIRRDYFGLSTKRKEGLLSHLAAKTFVNKKYFFKLSEVEKITEKYLKNMSIFSEETDFRDIIFAIEEQHGIIVKRSQNNIYSFAHLTFQEFFTAKYIVNNAQFNTINGLVDNYLFDDNWREVILLTSNMLEKADVLLKKINEKLSELLHVHPRISELVISLNDTCKTKSNSIHRVITFYWTLLIIGIFENKVDLIFRQTLEYLKTVVGYISKITNVKNIYIDNLDQWDYLQSVFKFAETIGALPNDFLFRTYFTKNKEIPFYLEYSGYRFEIIDVFDFIDFEKLIDFSYTFKLSDLEINSINLYVKTCILLVECIDSESYMTKRTREDSINNILLIQ